MPMSRFGGRNEGAHLREYGDNRVLAQKGRLARHVGTGQEPQATAFRAGVKLAIVGDEGSAGRHCAEPLRPPDGARP